MCNGMLYYTLSYFIRLEGHVDIVNGECYNIINGVEESMVIQGTVNPPPLAR